jgi:alkyldihydroxyacetonephosphate synthase
VGATDPVPNSASALDLRAVSRDLWPRDTLAWWTTGALPPRPERVFWPRTDAEVVAVFERAAAERRAVVPYGAGSGVCGGARGHDGAFVLDTKRLDRIGPLDVERGTVDVEAGVLGEHLEAWLSERGFVLGHSPSSIACSTVGGWAAARSAGQFSSRYGVFEDMILALTVVTPGRGVVRIGEDGDAPAEWLPLILGSEGTLGVVTRLRLRVHPAPATRWLRGYRFATVDAALAAMRGLMQDELWPAVVRLYDPVDTRIGGRTKPKKDGHGPSAWSRVRGAVERLPGAKERLLALPLALPGLLNRLADAVADGCLLIVGWEGDREVVDTLVAAAAPHLVGGEDLGAEPGERWFHSRHAVSYKLMPIFEGGGFADTMEVACGWGAMRAVYDAVRAAARPYAVVMAHSSHVYPEGGSWYFSFAGHGDLDTYDALWTACLDAAVAAGATATHHHGVGRLKKRWALAEAGAGRAAWTALKAELDPGRLLSPDADWSEAVDDVRCPPPSDPDLLRVPARSTFDDRVTIAAVRGVEARWSFADAAGLPSWQRWPWQTPYVEAHGRVGGALVSLGRAPRSAAGSDPRAWLLRQDPDATLGVGTVPRGPRFMGVGRPEHPGVVARALLRSDLRPAVLAIEEGLLIVGFRGPAAEALGRLAASRVPGGLEAVPWAPRATPRGPLVPCADRDPRVVHVTAEQAFRTGEPA